MIGAGISGLAAAWRLRALGWTVEVLEAGDTAGGRMMTRRLRNGLADLGAQFGSRGYHRLRRLSAAVGLPGPCPAASADAGLWVDGAFHHFAPAAPWRLACSGALSPTDWLRLGWGHVRFARRYRARALNDPTVWVDLQAQPAREWCVAQFGAAATQRLLAPMVAGLFFDDLDTAAAALPAILWRFRLDDPRLRSLPGGNQRLPQALADALGVRYHAEVTAVRETADEVTVTCADGHQETADQVVLAIPAPDAQRLWAGRTDAERTLLATPYTRTVVVALSYPDGIARPRVLARSYGVLMDATEPLLAALSFESRKSPDRVDTGEILLALLKPEAAAALEAASDAEIQAQVEHALERLLGTPARAAEAAVAHWRHAMPTTRPGRLAAICAYRAAVSTGRRLWLAGDLLAFPFSESAAEAGWQTAEALHAAATG
ncbi:MAG: protoporphyrinogen/coproporphyrinogen oxidase [Acidiferrobacteraceae bacterium]